MTHTPPHVAKASVEINQSAKGSIMKHVLGHLRRADEDFNMIPPDETIAVGVSGGKDSMVLLYALHLYQNFSRHAFRICAVTVDLGFGDFDIAAIADYCASLGIAHTCVKTHIAKVVFDTRQEQNPCALCAKMRKGALFTEILRQGISTCAFAHHRDDALESLLMSMLYEGRMRTFRPKTFLDRKGITLIRPFSYLCEKEIASAAARHSLPIAKNPCPVSGATKRQEVKDLLAQIGNIVPGARANMLTALKNVSQYSLWD
jgi:tRNA(Ile)-lysidine synthase TilS/MesJ